MGTRALTFVYDETGEKIVNMYRQYDGYPEGHGRELAEFLASFDAITNGIMRNDTRKTANGMACLAAQLVAHFKTSVGGFYIYPVNETDCGQDFEYHVRYDTKYGQFYIKVMTDTVAFDGTLEEFCAYTGYSKVDKVEVNQPCHEDKFVYMFYWYETHVIVARNDDEACEILQPTLDKYMIQARGKVGKVEFNRVFMIKNCAKFKLDTDSNYPIGALKKIGVLEPIM